MHPIVFPLVLAFLLSTLYAVALSTHLGQMWARAKTWTTVVAGNTLVLVALALYDWQAAGVAFLFFAAAGVPIIVREVIAEFQREQRIAHLKMKD